MLEKNKSKKFEKWSATMLDFRRSGLSGRAFCDLHSIDRSIFAYWKKRCCPDLRFTSRSRTNERVRASSNYSSPFLPVILGKNNSERSIPRELGREFEKPDPKWLAEFVSHFLRAMK